MNMLCNPTFYLLIKFCMKPKEYLWSMLIIMLFLTENLVGCVGTGTPPNPIFSIKLPPHSKFPPHSYSSQTHFLILFRALGSDTTMDWKGRSALFVQLIVVTCIFNVIDALNFKNNTHQAEYGQFLIANGVARTPPMG